MAGKQASGDLIVGHEYDGIQELDNSLPRWWLYGFYFTIVFSVFYVLYFHVFGSGNVMEDELQQEMDEARRQLGAAQIGVVEECMVRPEDLLG